MSFSALEIYSTEGSQLSFALPLLPSLEHHDGLPIDVKFASLTAMQGELQCGGMTMNERLFEAAPMTEWDIAAGSRNRNPRRKAVTRDSTERGGTPFRILRWVYPCARELNCLWGSFSFGFHCSGVLSTQFR